MGGTKRRGSNASSYRGRGRTATASTRGSSNANTSGFDWNEECELESSTAGPNEDNIEATPGGSGRGRGGSNNKQERSTSSARTEERVPTKRGGGARGGHYQGPQVRPGSQRVAVENPKNPRDCRDKSKIWACPLIECRGHVNYNWQKQCFSCKTYFYMDRGGNWVPSTKPSGQPGGHRGFP